jgi:hypothetical protein
MPYLRLTPSALAAMKAMPNFKQDETAEFHDDGSVTFFLTASTVMRLQRLQRRGETLSDVIERMFAYARRP